MSDDKPNPESATPRASRLGLALFFLYLAMYLVFMVWNAFSPRSMGEPFLGGMNLAITYGMVLILSAFVLALIYTWFSRKGGGS